MSMGRKAFGIRVIGIILACTVIIVSLPNNVYASEDVAEEDLAVRAESVTEEEPAIEEEQKSEDETLTASEAAYSVEGGAYTYDADMIETQDYKELFSAIYNDRRTELFGGRYYTGEQVVSLTGKSGNDVTITRKSDHAAVNASAVTGAVEFADTALPWELADDFSYTVNICSGLINGKKNFLNQTLIFS